MAEHFPNEGNEGAQIDSPVVAFPQTALVSGSIRPVLSPVGFAGQSDAARAGADMGLNDWWGVEAPSGPKATLTVETQGDGSGNPSKPEEPAPVTCWGCWLLRIVLLLLLAWAIDKVSSDD
jgi:hypothetical protein